MQKILIGTYHEKEARTIQKGTSYAADYINHLTIPGDYDAYLLYDYSIADGVEHVNAKNISVTLPTNITDGKYFSGFAGNNFSSTDAQTGPSEIHLNPYAYRAKDMVEDGTLELLPEFGFLANPWGLCFSDYLAQKRAGLYNYFGLDPYGYAKTPEFASCLAVAIDAMMNDGEWRGWDISTLETASKMRYVYFGNVDDRIILTHQGKEFLEGA